MSIKDLLETPDEIVEACSMIAAMDHQRVKMNFELESKASANRDEIKRMVSGA